MGRYNLPTMTFKQFLKTKYGSTKNGISYLASETGYNEGYLKHIVYGIEPATYKVTNNIGAVIGHEIAWKMLLPNDYGNIMGGNNGC